MKTEQIHNRNFELSHQENKRLRSFFSRAIQAAEKRPAFCIVLFVCTLAYLFMPLQGQTQVFLPDAPQVKTTTKAGLPESWQAQGRVLDQYDRPVEGAWVETARPGGQRVATDALGRFTLYQVTGQTAIHVEKDNHLDSDFHATELQWFFHDDGQAEVQLRLPVFDLRFAVGPRGGIFRGVMDVEVPAGALDEMTEIKVAVLPPGYRGRMQASLVPASYGTVHFEPAGLHFKKPIRIRQTGTGDLSATDAAPGVVQVVRGSSGFELHPVPNANLVLNGQNWYYSLSHFSEYRLVDNSRLVEMYIPSLEAADSNMDGAVNEQDAERILRLEGGTQTFEYQVSIKQTQTLSHTRSAGSRSESERTTSAEGSASIGGLELGASKEESLKRAGELAERFGFEQQVSRESRYTLRMSVNEYETNCKMIFVRYNFRRFREYVRHTPTDKELQKIKAAYDKHRQPGQEWVHVRVQGETSYTVGISLYDGMRLAVRMNAANEPEVFVLADEYTLRTLRGFEQGNCDNYASPAHHRLKYEDYAQLPPSGAQLYHLEYKGYLHDANPIDDLKNCECGIEVEKTIKETRRRMGFHEITASTENSSSNTRGISAKGSINLPAGVTLGGGASAKTTRATTATASHGLGSNQSEEDETELLYKVLNAHEEHESDHEFYRLYHLYEMREWHYRFHDELRISNRLKQNMRRDIKSNFLRGQTSDGRLILLRQEDGREYWYEAGPPIELIREAGYLLKRVAERPCKKPVAVPAHTPKSGDTTPSPGRRSGSPGDQSSRSGFRMGASLTVSGRPLPVHVSGQAIAETFMNEVFSNPLVFEQLMEKLGGEFILGLPTGQLLPDVEMKGTARLMPGLSLGVNFAGNFEIGLGVHYFQADWSGRFPISVFPFSSTAPRTEYGAVRASASGILADMHVAYLFPGSVFRPFVEAGARGQLPIDNRSGIDLAGVTIPYDRKPVSSQVSLVGGAGARICLGQHAYVQAGASLAKWPGSKYAPGGRVELGYRF